MTVVIRSLSGFLAALLVIAAFLGPLFTETITFYVSESARSQYLGGETVTLIAAVVLAVRASTRAQWVVTLLPGVCLYLIYTFTTVVAGQSYGLYAATNANAKMAFPMYALITACAAVLLTFTLMGTCTSTPSRKAVTATRWFLAILGLLFGTLWAMQILEYHSGTETAVHDGDPALFWLIKFLDYAFLIPALLITAGTLPRTPAPTAARVLLVFATFLAAAITGMAVAQAFAGEAGAWGVVVFMTTVTTVAGCTTYPWLRAAQNNTATPGLATQNTAAT